MARYPAAPQWDGRGLPDACCCGRAGFSRLDPDAALCAARAAAGARYRARSAIGSVRLVATLGVDTVPAMSMPLGTPSGRYDAHCSLMSLPTCFAIRLSQYRRRPICGCRATALAAAGSRIFWRRARPRRQRAGRATSRSATSNRSPTNSISSACSPRTPARRLARHRGIDPGWSSSSRSTPQSHTSPARSACRSGSCCGRLRWRWQRRRNDSPWYPAARLFRQTAPGDWRPVVAAVAAALREEIVYGRLLPPA